MQKSEKLKQLAQELDTKYKEYQEKLQQEEQEEEELLLLYDIIEQYAQEAANSYLQEQKGQNKNQLSLIQTVAEKVAVEIVKQGMEQEEPLSVSCFNLTRQLLETEGWQAVEKKEKKEYLLDKIYHAYRNCKEEEKDLYFYRLYSEFEPFAQKIARKQIYMQGITEAERDILCENAVETVKKTLFLGESGQRQIDTYEAKNGSTFSGFCSDMIRKKAITEVNKAVKQSIIHMANSIDAMRETGEEASYEEKGSLLFANPETYLLEVEQKKEVIDCVKLLMEVVAEGPLGASAKFKGEYRTVGGAFGKYLPFFENTLSEKKASAPTWAYRQIKQHHVEAAADEFCFRMKEYAPELEFGWSSDYYKKIQETAAEDGYLTYGEHTQEKNFENWVTFLHREVLARCGVKLEQMYQELREGSLEQEQYEDVLQEVLKKQKKKAKKQVGKQVKKQADRKYEL